MSLEMLRAMFARPRPVALPAPPRATLPDVLRAVGFVAFERWARHLAAPCERFAIRPGVRLAAFAATIAHESAGGTILTENLNYSVAGLQATWPARFPRDVAERLGRDDGRAAQQAAIANRAYASRMGNGAEASGDGWRYRGRGLIQLTGRDAYARAGAALLLPLEETPDLAADERHAAMIAAWTWAVWKGCNALADAGDVAAWRKAINGGHNGLADVRKRYAAALAA